MDGQRVVPFGQYDGGMGVTPRAVANRIRKYLKTGITEDVRYTYIPERHEGDNVVREINLADYGYEYQNPAYVKSMAA